MTGKVKELNSENFDEFISKGECIVDFWAEWCMPCKMLSPVFSEIAEEMKGKIKFGKINVEDEPMLAERYMVMSVPSLIFFKDGEQVDAMKGAMEKEELAELIEKVFS